MNELVHDPVRRQRLGFSREGDVLHAEVWVEPRGDVPAHYHPAQEERFEVIAGNVRFTIDGKRIEAGPGTRLVAPVGVKHSFRNTGDVEAHLQVEVEPAMALQGFLEEAAALARAGRYTRHGLPTRPAAIVELADLMVRYSDTTVMAFPPRTIQRLTLWPLARLRRKQT
ncbi:MAG TPA: cupin domain-containing protein [Solirubrobacteraceae bacterium]|nr:cupin domain-containing protein [Solirubrobacteraceae bacterium]